MFLARTVLTFGVAAAAPAAPAAPAVVTDVAPIHSIVAQVMEGIGEPHLLLPPGASPHEYALHPSEAGALEEAEIVFWVGEGYTPWLADPIATLAANANNVALQDAPEVRLLPVREGGPFEHAAHGENGHDTVAHDEPRDNATAHQEHDEALLHAPGTAVDGHLWLDPLNATAIARAAADALAGSDPANADRYRTNAEAFAEDMRALVAKIRRELAPAQGRRFVVFHDAFQYFENRFGMPASGSIALHDADQPSPARMAAIRDRIRADAVECVFAEPQFPASLVETAIEGTGARRGTLDPIGVDLDPGPNFYAALIGGLADDLVACLTAD